MRNIIFSKKSLIGIPYSWLIVFFVIPFLIVLKISLSDTEISRPPYSPKIEVTSLESIKSGLSELDTESYQFLLEDDLYWKSYLSSIKIALIATFLVALIAYPIAYAISRAPEKYRGLLLILVILPFWTSFLVRVYAWIGILKNDGFLNQFLLWLGVIDSPFIILNTNIAVYIGIVYSYLPYMILPIYASLDKMDYSLIEAAEDMGCTKIKSFFLVTLPLSAPGIIAGCFLVFIPATGEFVIPDLLGGSDTLMIGKTMWTEFFYNRDWPVASAVAIVLLFVLLIPIIIFQRNQTKQDL